MVDQAQGASFNMCVFFWDKTMQSTSPVRALQKPLELTLVLDALNAAVAAAYVLSTPDLPPEVYMEEVCKQPETTRDSDCRGCLPLETLAAAGVCDCRGCL